VSATDLRALITEGRKHDAAMTPGPWQSSWSDVATTAVVDVESAREVVAVLDRINDAAGVAWIRNHLTTLLGALERYVADDEAAIADNKALTDEELARAAQPWSDADRARANSCVIRNAKAERDHLRAENERLTRERDEALQSVACLRAENAQLTTRRDELLALVAKVSRETPYPAELDECRSARSALIAEVGTLRAAGAELCAAAVSAIEGVAELEWTPEAHEQRRCESSDYVDGWNNARAAALDAIAALRSGSATTGGAS